MTRRFLAGLALAMAGTAIFLTLIISTALIIFAGRA